MQRAARPQGFTVVELVVVIMILAILAAFAIPRFISLEAQARTASRDALAGSVRSAAALAHALWLASNRPAAVSMENRVIGMTNGYPDVSDIDAALVDASGYTYAVTGPTGTFTHADAPTCTVSYTNAGEHAGPQISVSGGC